MKIYEDKLFPWILDWSVPKEMAEQRRLALQDVQEPVLEIGIGSGANLPFYPACITRLSAVEPLGSMQKRAQKRAESSGRIIDWHTSTGELLPFGDEEFSTVVTTDVLCTVTDVTKVLGEAFRVLKPGGQLHFLEHGIARLVSLQKWQYRLNGFSKLIGCGCNLTRDIERHLRKSDFFLQEIHYIPPFSGMYVLYTHVRGIARKPLLKITKTAPGNS